LFFALGKTPRCTETPVNMVLLGSKPFKTVPSRSNEKSLKCHQTATKRGREQKKAVGRRAAVFPAGSGDVGGFCPVQPVQR